MSALWIDGMKGLGDNLYQRPFVRAAASREEVWLTTPWPELYADLEVCFVKGGTCLRTQAKNIARQSSGLWSHPPPAARRVELGYHRSPEGSILQAFEASVPIEGLPEMDLPPLPESPIPGRYGVVRPVTLRAEWLNSARNPRPEYIEAAAVELRRRGITVVSVADVEPDREWFAGRVPPADVRFHRGQLEVEQLLALVRNATIVIGGVGWIVPACLASRSPLLVLGGGMGGSNGPERLIDPRLSASHIHWLLPSPYCACREMEHDCPKQIPDFERRLARSLDTLLEADV